MRHLSASQVDAFAKIAKIRQVTGKRQRDRFWCLRVLLPVCWGANKRLRRSVEFHVLRDMFIKDHSLPATFNFDKYLRKSVSHSVIDMLEISLSAWSSWVLLLLVFIGFRAAMDPNDHSSAFFSLFVGWFLLLLDLCIFVALKRARRIFMRRAGVR